ncbi:hypothetical protein J2R96_006925 [Bradyrhizobium elkanii]|nr:hypothetical protein [Bradyrhizobium elkanii]
MDDMEIAKSEENRTTVENAKNLAATDGSVQAA